MTRRRRTDEFTCGQRTWAAGQQTTPPRCPDFTDGGGNTETDRLRRDYFGADPALDLSKSARPSTYNTVGQIITYTYIVRNSGNVTLTGPFIVTDNKIGSPVGTPFACGTGPLAPNQITSCTAFYTITQADVDAGSVTNTASVSTSYTDYAGNSETVTSNSASATVSVRLVSTSALTHSASKSTTEISNQLVTDFEILLNGQKSSLPPIQASSSTTSGRRTPTRSQRHGPFVLDWTDKFEAQTVSWWSDQGLLAASGSSSFVNWTSHATRGAAGTSATDARPTRAASPSTTYRRRDRLGDGPYRFQAEGLEHLDPFAQPNAKPVVYGPLSSSITIRDQQSTAVIGTSFSSTTVIGRGKKVTLIYGTAFDAAGAPLADTWIQVKQGTNTAMTKTDPLGSYVFFDGQLCAPGDGNPRLVHGRLDVVGELRHRKREHADHVLWPKPVGALHKPELPEPMDQGGRSNGDPICVARDDHSTKPIHVHGEEGRRIQPRLQVPQLTPRDSG